MWRQEDTYGLLASQDSWIGTPRLEEVVEEDHWHWLLAATWMYIWCHDPAHMPDSVCHVFLCFSELGFYLGFVSPWPFFAFLELTSCKSVPIVIEHSFHLNLHKFPMISLKHEFLVNISVYAVVKTMLSSVNTSYQEILDLMLMWYY